MLYPAVISGHGNGITVAHLDASSDLISCTQPSSAVVQYSGTHVIDCSQHLLGDHTCPMTLMAWGSDG